MTISALVRNKNYTNQFKYKVHHNILWKSKLKKTF